MIAKIITVAAVFVAIVNAGIIQDAATGVQNGVGATVNVGNTVANRTGSVALGASRAVIGGSANIANASVTTGVGLGVGATGAAGGLVNGATRLATGIAGTTSNAAANNANTAINTANSTANNPPSASVNATVNTNV